MSSDKEKEALAGSEDEKTALKVGDSSPGMDDSTFDQDNSRARFISGNSNSHAKGDMGATPEVYVDVEGKTKTKLADNEFVGLTKDQLMQYANDPKWKKIRLAFLIMFWVGWFGMLAAAIIIIVLAPKCPPKPKLDWWQKSTVYQVFPKSFKDSNSDGIGDLKGMY
jgi:neutral and basic amino acid transporter 1